MGQPVKSKLIAFDSDPVSLSELERALRTHFSVITVTSPLQFASALATHADARAVIVSSAKGSDPLSLLDAARRARPKIMRMLYTAFEDLSLIVEGLHSGAIQRVISKPVQFVELLAALPRFEGGSSSALSSVRQ